MDQRELVRQLEEYFRKRDQAHYDQRKRVHEERGQLTDDEWWEQLVEQTKAIRPQMLEIFERNKQEMITKRFQTVSSEEGFREKALQKQVMELLPHISAVRVELGETGNLTESQILLAVSRMEQNSPKRSSEWSEPPSKN